MLLKYLLPAYEVHVLLEPSDVIVKTGLGYQPSK